MADHTITVEILDVKRMKSSRNGNPRFSIYCGQPGYGSGWMNTKPDTSIALEMTGSERGLYKITYNDRNQVWDLKKVGHAPMCTAAHDPAKSDCSR